MSQAIGMTLRRERERLRLDLSDVAQELEAREVELLALEERSTAGLWTARERALLRVYARRLNVDAEPALRELPAAERQGPAASATAAGRWSIPAGPAGNPGQGTTGRADIGRARGRPRGRRALTAAAALALLVGAAVVATLVMSGFPG